MVSESEMSVSQVYSSFAEPVVFTDHEAASKNWREADSIKVTMRHIADIDLWRKEKPFYLSLALPEGQPRSNFLGSNHDALICNVRGRQSDFSLDEQGFAFAKVPTFGASFEDIAAIEHRYLPEMTEFLKKELSADEVFVFDYKRRRRDPLRSEYEERPYDEPGTLAHVDQTPGGALNRLRHHFGKDGGDIGHSRMQIINLWRPTFGPIEDCPLAVCDARTLEANDLIAADIVFSQYIGEKYDIKWSAKHRWYYLRDMMEDECILIKNFDTAVDGRARLCGHGAFIDPTTPDGARPRESIEIRAMVFHHES